MNPLPDNTPHYTRIEKHGDIYIKRDDTYRIAGICGGKVRTCWHLAQGGAGPRLTPGGLITASARKSPQAQIVARLAARLGIPARLHMPNGEDTPEMKDIRAHGGEIIQHKAGYNNVLIARANYDADQHPGWRNIPFGMECQEAIFQNSREAHSLHAHLAKIKRVVVPVGSGMTLAGVTKGILDLTDKPPRIVGVRVGADPMRRLNRWMPFGWRRYVDLVDVTNRIPYHTPVVAELGGVVLDEIYESKCVEFLRPGDLFWVVGIRTKVS